MSLKVVADPEPVLDPTVPGRDLGMAMALRGLGLIALAAGVESCTDSGQANAGTGGGNLVLVTTTNPHGLDPGDHVVLAGTAYDGDREVEPVGVAAFLLLNVAFTAPSFGGTWSPA